MSVSFCLRQSRRCARSVRRIILGTIVLRGAKRRCNVLAMAGVQRKDSANVTMGLKGHSVHRNLRNAPMDLKERNAIGASKDDSAILVL